MTYKRKPKESVKEKNLPQKVKQVEGKTKNQRDYIRAILENDIIICTGPAGCGKSYIAAGISCDHLHRGDIDQIIITRPLVCAGKDIGALPGELADKINPYLKPMQENMRFFLGQAYYGAYIMENKIRYEPLEMMRGSTFHNSYIILDEAQNCTAEQIKMFMTRIGENSKVLINGDLRQTDIRNKSGLWQCMEKVKNVEGVSVVSLDNSDIQRHGIIARILTALEDIDG